MHAVWIGGSCGRGGLTLGDIGCGSGGGDSVPWPQKVVEHVFVLFLDQPCQCTFQDLLFQLAESLLDMGKSLNHLHVCSDMCVPNWLWMAIVSTGKFKPHIAGVRISPPFFRHIMLSMWVL